MGDVATRQRYWARSLLGWRLMAGAQPCAAHRALAALEDAGHVELLLTQNVDGLHQAAGSRRTLDLHGRIDTVRCMHCQAGAARVRCCRQRRCGATPYGPRCRPAPRPMAMPSWCDFSGFDVPACAQCGVGLLKPDVVFFGENVPRERVDAARAALERADAVLVAGSSRWCIRAFAVRAAVDRGLLVAAINQDARAPTICWPSSCSRTSAAGRCRRWLAPCIEVSHQRHTRVAPGLGRRRWW